MRISPLAHIANLPIFYYICITNPLTFNHIPMDFTTLIQNRYSCRAFATMPVEQEKVDRVLEAGRIAPTAVNRQPVHVWAVSDPGVLEAIKGVTRSNYGAPLLLVVGCRPADAWVRRYDNKNGAEEGYELVAMINVGYAAEGSAPSEKHWSRVGMGEFVTEMK